jgi:hypothetical protein
MLQKLKIAIAKKEALRIVFLASNAKAPKKAFSNGHLFLSIDVVISQCR